MTANSAGTTALSRATAACRGQVWLVAGFSGVANLLQLTASLYMMQVFDRVLAARSVDTLLHLTLIAVFALAVLAALEACRGVVMSRLAAWMEWRVAPEGLSRAMEAALRGLPYRGEALRDLAALRAWLGSPGAVALFDLPWVPVYLAVIFLLHPLLGGIALAGAAALLAVALWAEAATARPLRDAVAPGVAAQRRAESLVRGAEVVDALGMAGAARAHWQRDFAASLAPQARAADRVALALAATRFLRLLVQIAVLAAGAWLVLGGGMTAGATVAASIIMGRALAPVEQAVSGWKPMVQARQAWRRLSAFLALPPLRADAPAPPAPRGAVSVERAVLARPGGGEPLIKGVSFALRPGQSLAIIGPSAAGKSTLLRLVLGTLAPSAGAVRLDGAEVAAWPREALGRHVGFLPQEVELFEGTVMDNIARLEEPDAEACYAAARLAGCHEMILRLPQGYATRVGEGGLRLSGGQRQMVGLARALYGAPRLVALDEPDTHLDGDGEARLMRCLAALREAAVTVLVVTHRPALLQAVDQALVLRDGALEMWGPRAEVLRRLMAPAPLPPATPGKEVLA